MAARVPGFIGFGPSFARPEGSDELIKIVPELIQFEKRVELLLVQDNPVLDDTEALRAKTRLEQGAI